MLRWFNFCGQGEVVSVAGAALHCCAPVSSAAAWAQRVCYCTTEGESRWAAAASTIDCCATEMAVQPCDVFWQQPYTLHAASANI